MLASKAVLIIEDNVYLAMDLADAVVDLDGRVLGPVSTLDEAFAILDAGKVGAAVLDYELPGVDVAPLARAFVALRVPFVIHTARSIRPEVTLLRPGTPVLMKPIRPCDLVSILAHEVIRAEEV